MGIRQIRNERGLTGAQLAVLARVDQATISRAERGIQQLKPANLVNLSKALKVPPKRLSEGNEE